MTAYEARSGDRSVSPSIALLGAQSVIWKETCRVGQSGRRWLSSLALHDWFLQCLANRLGFVCRFDRLGFRDEFWRE